MADTEFTFESEQILKQQSKRKYIIIAAIIAAAAALVALGVILIVQAQKKKHRSEEGLPYAYTWKEKSDATIDLELDQSSAPGYCWTLQSVTSDVLRVLAPASQNSKKAGFTLEMDESGLESASFILQNTADPTDRIYEMRFIFEQAVDDAGKFLPSLQYVYGRNILSTFSGGENTAHPYHFTESQAGGAYTLSIYDNEEYFPEEEPARYVDLKTGEDISKEEHWKQILEIIKNKEKVESDSGSDSDAEAEWRDPFTGELVTEEEWRKTVLEHLDELEALIASETEEQPEPRYRLHEDWTAVSTNDAIVAVNSVIPISLTENFEFPIDELSAESEDTGSEPVEIETAEPEEEPVSPFGGESDQWIRCRLIPGSEPGSCTVTIRSDSAGAAVVMDFQIAEDGALSVLNHRLETFEPVESTIEVTPEEDEG